MERFKWYLKQLLPLMYWTTYAEKGIDKIVIWRMWFGRCFNIHEFNLAK